MSADLADATSSPGGRRAAEGSSLPRAHPYLRLEMVCAVNHLSLALCSALPSGVRFRHGPQRSAGDNRLNGSTWEVATGCGLLPTDPEGRLELFFQEPHQQVPHLLRPVGL